MKLTQRFEPDKNPQLLFFTNTEQGRLQILQNEGYIWLTINDILQTAIERQPPYISALPHCMVMLLPLLHDNAPKNILELGGGGLAIQRFMAATRPHIKMTSIEIQSEIIDAVSAHFPGTQGLHVIQADAQDFVENAISRQLTYDYLIVDLYRGQESPMLQSNSEMLSQFNYILEDKGWLVINCLTNDKVILKRLTKHLKAEFGILPKIFAVPEMLNHIFMLKKGTDFKFPPDISQHNLIESDGRTRFI